MNIESTIFNNRSRLLRHSSFWVASSLIYFLSDSKDPGILWFVFCLFVMIYVSFYLFDSFFSRKRVIVYILLQVTLVVAFRYFIRESYNLIEAIFGLESGEKESEFRFSEIWLHCSLIGLILIALIVRNVIYGIFIVRVFETITMKTEQHLMERELLKSQINPHFLFNILSTIYATNMQDRTKGNELILELAQQYRYQNGISKKDKIKLDEEIGSIVNYINLERIRIHNCQVEIIKKGDFDRFEITPLLLIPIVENAFKYGAGIETSNINVGFVMEGNTFCFSCINTVQRGTNPKQSTGIGLANVRKRLAYIYPKQHLLKVDNDSGLYRLELRIDLTRIPFETLETRF